MGGVGVTISSKDPNTPAAASTPLTNLPPGVVQRIVDLLGITTNDTKQALLAGKIDLPDNVEVMITRKITDDSLTLKKIAGGSQYELRFKGNVERIPGGG